MHILIVDLLAERQAFGREGVREILTHFESPSCRGDIGIPLHPKTTM